MNINDKTIEESSSSANNLVAADAPAGAIGTAGALVTEAVCPLCIIATPVLIGAGLVRRLRLSRKEKAASEAKP